MTDTCTYSGNRDESLIAYLYEDGDPVARRAFERHLDTCGVCRTELEALGGVRQALARWAPPEPKGLIESPSGPQSAVRNPQWWRMLPVWAQVAAALLFLGVSAGLANLDVRYDSNGLTVRTGWKAPTPEPAVSRVGPAAPSVTRADLVALEQQLRAELRTSTASLRTASAAAPVRPAASDADTLRQMRSLLDQSEKRQQRELALRVAELVQDGDAKRQADLVRIDRSLRGVESGLGAEVMKQRQSLNILYSRASFRQ